MKKLFLAFIVLAAMLPLHAQVTATSQFNANVLNSTTTLVSSLPSAAAAISVNATTTSGTLSCSTYPVVTFYVTRGASNLDVADLNTIGSGTSWTASPNFTTLLQGDLLYAKLTTIGGSCTNELPLTVSITYLPAAGLCYGSQSACVTLSGYLAGSNGQTSKNYTMTFQPSQLGYVAGSGSTAGAIVNTPVNCATSVDGSVVGLGNPLTKTIVTPSYSGTLGASTYYTRYTFYDFTGAETLPSPETITLLGSTGQLSVAPPISGIPSGAVGMRVYISTSSNTETLQGQTVGVGNFIQSVPLVTGAALPTINGTACKIIANDALWPTGTGYNVALTDVNGNSLPGYPMQWQLMGPGTTINLSSGLPYYHGVVMYPSPILASPLNHSTQSIFGGLQLYGALTVDGNISAIGDIAAATMAGVIFPDTNPNCTGTDIGAKINSCYAQYCTPGPTSCKMQLLNTTYQFSTPILFNVANACVMLYGVPSAGTILNYTPNTNTFGYTEDCGSQQEFGHGMRDLAVLGPGYASTPSGIDIASSGWEGDDLLVAKFAVGKAIVYGEHGYFSRISHSNINGMTFAITSGSAGEQHEYDHVLFSGTPGTYTPNCVTVGGGSSAFNMIASSFDGCQLVTGGSNGGLVNLTDFHFECYDTTTCTTPFIVNTTGNAVIAQNGDFLKGDSSNLSELVEVSGGIVKLDHVTGFNHGGTVGSIVNTDTTGGAFLNDVVNLGSIGAIATLSGSGQTSAFNDSDGINWMAYPAIWQQPLGIFNIQAQAGQVLSLSSGANGTPASNLIKFYDLSTGSAIEEWQEGPGSTFTFGLYDAVGAANRLNFIQSGANNYNVPTSFAHNFQINGTTVLSIGEAGSAGAAMCYKSDGKTLGYCSSVVGAGGLCTCN